MGRGTSAAARSARINKIKSLQKNLKSAKTAETKAYKAYMTARGAERMSPSAAIRSERRKATTKAFQKYTKAQDRVTKIESQINRYNKTNQRQSGQTQLMF